MDEKILSGEQYKTDLINDCNTWEELMTAIEKCKWFISFSREIPVVYEEYEMRLRLKQVMDGHPINLLTRANNLRAKAIELFKKYDESNKIN